MAAAQAKAGLPGNAYSGVYPLLLPLPIPADPPQFLAASSEVIEEYNSKRDKGGATRSRRPLQLWTPATALDTHCT